MSLLSASSSSGSLSSRSSSPSFAGSASTTPSTPIHSTPTVFLITHPASAPFLKALPVCTGSGDRVLIFTGAGLAKPLLAQASQVLADASLLDSAKWESVKAVDDNENVVFWRTSSDISSFASPPHDSLLYLDKLSINTKEVSEASALNLFSNSNLRALISLPSSSSLTLHILERPPFSFPLLSQTPSTVLNPNANAYTIPSSSCFRDLWSAWDLVTLGMIPQSMLHQKPIDLRHKPLFYIGHLPTFNALLLTKLLRVPMVEPRNFGVIFERGIDPHVDDPDHCHSHSEVPEKDEDWPHLGQVLAFRDRVRALVMKTLGELEDGTRVLTRRIARTLVMMHEHEGFHIETLLYMLIQRAGTGTLPPPGFAAPAWAHLSTQWDTIPAPTTSSVTLGPCTLEMGHDDQEPQDLLSEFEGDVAGHEFGWDNESPKRSVVVGKFRVEWRPISNGEFLAFWKKMDGKVDMPASWVEEEREMKVRTLYGPVSMEYAQHWPCLTAYDDLLAYARSKGGRLPTESELRLFLDTYQVGHEEGSNTGFRNWHPLPAMYL
ncbi:hypothetical protein PHLCEN_2v11526 [Hermanssonia centrifuga]|uniref:Uncharacterized protein n=1 Tax=Hermanssonia centrifuga TaxID=98765 RepID=A0A2R6NKT4_9APHY|nr:hypothetical protein PHLCEN_2v11526 [Hermanssonia centrifuga]